MSTAANFLFGARKSNSANQYSFLGASTGVYRSDYATVYGSFPASLNTTDAILIDKNKNVTTINGGNAVTAAATTFSAGSPLVLFGVNTAGTITYGKVTIHRAKIYDNGTLVRDFVPVRNSSGTLGLYDTVNGTFYANAGSGTFTAGADINNNFIAGTEITN